MVKVRNNVNQVTRDILIAISNRHSNDFFITECKNGPTQMVTEFLQMDAVAIRKSWAHPCVSAYEVKSNRADFMADTKWPGYKAYCNQLSFACPEGVIKPEELPDEIGLYYYKPDRKFLKAVRKPLFRDVTIPSEFFLYIIFNHFSNDRIPFYSNAKEFFYGWLEKKQENRYFGRTVKSAMLDRMEELQEENKKLQLSKEESAVYDSILQVIRKHGLPRWNIAENLDKALTMKCNPAAEEPIERIEGELKRLKNYIGMQTK